MHVSPNSRKATWCSPNLPCAAPPCRSACLISAYLVGLLDSYGIPVDPEMFSEELEMSDEPAPQRRADIAVIN
jgi:hypothetical protein